MSRQFVCLALLCVPGVLSGCTADSARFAESPPAWLTLREGRLLEAVNHERAMRGLSPVLPDPRLIGLALRSSQAMAELGRCEHVGRVGDKLTAIQYAWRSAGENVATAQLTGGARLAASDDRPRSRLDADSTVDALHEQLMASPPHRANILKPAFTRIGVAIVGRSDGIYVTEIFATP